MARQGSPIQWRQPLRIALLALLGLPMLSACGGGGEPPATATSETTAPPQAGATAPTAASPMAPETAPAGETGAMASEAIELVAAGEQVYTQNCASCHQPDGRGLPNVFPPMVGSEWVTGNPEILLRIILNGQQGPVEVAGVTYEGAMPAWAGTLSDEDIAAVATYIRQLDENEAGPVTPDQVAAVRAATADRTTPWTAEELRALETGPTP